MVYFNIFTFKKEPSKPTMRTTDIRQYSANLEFHKQEIKNSMLLWKESSDFSTDEEDIILININIILPSMGKQPVQGQKKSKDAIAKAATQKKKVATKKWTKGKVKEKADHAVFLDKATHDKIISSVPKLGRHISVSHLVDKYKIVGSIARTLLRKCVENGSIVSVQKHSKQALFTPVAVPEKPAAATSEAKDTGKKGKKK